MMDEQYRAFIQEEEAEKQRERAVGLFRIDSHRSKPRIRHLGREQEDGSMLTICGRRVVYYSSAVLTGFKYADGRIYARPCPRCFPAKEEVRE
jgi:hypothetical protein